MTALCLTVCAESQCSREGSNPDARLMSLALRAVFPTRCSRRRFPSCASSRGRGGRARRRNPEGNEGESRPPTTSRMRGHFSRRTRERGPEWQRSTRNIGTQWRHSHGDCDEHRRRKHKDVESASRHHTFVHFRVGAKARRDEHGDHGRPFTERHVRRRSERTLRQGMGSDNLDR